MIKYEESATKTNRDLWVSANGNYFFDEHLAKMDGCTHRKCQCGNYYKHKYYTLCEDCLQKAKDERFNAYPIAEWDGVTPVCIYDSDTYFFYEEDIEEYCDEYELNIDELQLVLCEPSYARPIDLYDINYDELPDDDSYEFPEYINNMVKELNDALSKLEPLSWFPGKTRVKINGY
jgi:hypothetical protein